MKGLAHPAVAAGAAALFALVLHPAARAEVWLPSGALVTAALALFLGLALVARAFAHAQLAGRLVAIGALLVVGALGYDGARGLRGTLSLGVGDATNNFTEEGPGGRRLGLRPLGFPLGLERVRAGGAVDVGLPTGSVELLPTRAIGYGAFRLGGPRSIPTGDVVRLVVNVTGGPEPLQAVVTPSQPGHAGDLTVGLERYFPDFALDDKQQPMTRSAESLNPAALLKVDRGAKVYRVFVLGSMPGLHRVEELGRSFALAGVEPDVRVDVAVVQEPAAPVALLGVLIAAAGLALAALAGLRRADPGPVAP